MGLLRNILGPKRYKRTTFLSLNQESYLGTKNAQVQLGWILSIIVSKTEIQSMLGSPSMGFKGKKYANFYLEQIGKNIGPKVVLEVTDNIGVTRDGRNSKVLSKWLVLESKCIR